jgi:hypothetical protein
LAEQYPGNAAIQQRLNALTTAVNANLRPETRNLPEPIREEINSQSDINPVRQ